MVPALLKATQMECLSSLIKVTGEERKAEKPGC